MMSCVNCWQQWGLTYHLKKQENDPVFSVLQLLPLGILCSEEEQPHWGGKCFLMAEKPWGPAQSCSLGTVKVVGLLWSLALAGWKLPLALLRICWLLAPISGKDEVRRHILCCAIPNPICTAQVCSRWGLQTPCTQPLMWAFGCFTEFMSEFQQLGLCRDSVSKIKTKACLYLHIQFDSKNFAFNFCIQNFLQTYDSQLVPSHPSCTDS